MGMSYANFLIAKRVAADSKVVLSGTGGDELHGGYVGRYQVVSAHGAQPSSWRHFLRQLIAPDREEPASRRAYKEMLNFPVHRGRVDNLLTPAFRASATQYDPQSAFDKALDACPYSNPLDLVIYKWMHAPICMASSFSKTSSRWRARLKHAYRCSTTSLSILSARCHGHCSSTGKPARKFFESRSAPGFLLKSTRSRKWDSAHRTRHDTAVSCGRSSNNSSAPKSSQRAGCSSPPRCGAAWMTISRAARITWH